MTFCHFDQDGMPKNPRHLSGVSRSFFYDHDAWNDYENQSKEKSKETYSPFSHVDKIGPMNPMVKLLNHNWEYC